MGDLQIILNRKKSQWHAEAASYLLLALSLIALVASADIKMTDGVYDGDTDRSGVPHGEGTFYFATGKRGFYSGNWVRGKASGIGLREYADGSSYDGEWSKGKKHGAGDFRSVSGSRTLGSWENNRQEGTATVYLKGGDSYQGLWERGELLGAITWTYTNGDVFEGPFEPVGATWSGVLKKVNGDVYKGAILNGMPSGRGVYVHAESKATFSGSFTDGLKSGKGTLTTAEGSVFSGSWDLGFAVGTGTYQDSSGKVASGTFIAKNQNSWAPKLKLASSKLASSRTADRVKTNPPAPTDTLACEEFGFELTVLASSAWKTIEFSLLNGTSSCIK